MVIVLLIWIFLWRWDNNENSQQVSTLKLEDIRLNDNVNVRNRDNVIIQNGLQLIDWELADWQYVEYSDNNTIAAIYNFKDWKLNGDGLAFYENWNIHQESHYINWELNGSIISYFENGDIQAKIDYKNWKINGERIRYDEDRNLVYKWIYEDGELLEVISE